MRQTSGNSACRMRRSARVCCRARISASAMRARKARCPSLSEPACLRCSSMFCAACGSERRRRFWSSRSLSSLAIAVVLLLGLLLLVVVGGRGRGAPVDEPLVAVGRALMHASPLEVLIELRRRAGPALGQTTREQHRVRREVDLPLHAGGRLEAQVGPASRLRPEGLHVELEDAVAAGVADRADLLEHAHAAQLVGEHELVDERLEGIELARAPLALALDLTPEPGAHRPGVDPELARDGPVGLPRALEASDQLVAPLPSLSLALAIVFTDPSSVLSRETAFSAPRSMLPRISRSFPGGGARSRRLASVASASSRCRLRLRRCPSGDKRGSTGRRRVSGWCFTRLARGSESSARRAAGSFVRYHRLTSSSVSRGPSPALPTTAAISNWLPGGNESRRRADPGCSIPSFIDSKSSGCRRSTRPTRLFTHVLCREHSAAISVCVRPVLHSSRNTSPSSSVVIDEGPRLSSSIVAHCPVSSSGVTATTNVGQPSVVAAACLLKPSTSSTPSGLGTATTGVN